MGTIIAVVTDAAKAKAPSEFGGIVTPFAKITSFKVGYGGWTDPGTGQVPRAPDPALLDLDVIVDVGRAVADKRYLLVPAPVSIPYFQKSLLLGDFAYVTPGILLVDCLLDFGDYNNDGSGANPTMFEIGLFDADGTMLVYGTFPLEVKSSVKRVLNVIRIHY